MLIAPTDGVLVDCGQCPVVSLNKRLQAIRGFGELHWLHIRLSVPHRAAHMWHNNNTLLSTLHRLTPVLSCYKLDIVLDFTHCNDDGHGPSLLPLACGAPPHALPAATSFVNSYSSNTSLDLMSMFRRCSTAESAEKTYHAMASADNTVLAALPLRSVIRTMPSQSFTEVAHVEVTNLGSKK
jgi:hypothetical protein